MACFSEFRTESSAKGIVGRMLPVLTSKMLRFLSSLLSGSTFPVRNV